MIRSLLATLMLAAAVHGAEVAPPPREVAAPEDAAKMVERIIRNARDVGDRLAKHDPGRDTRDRQGDILRDIEALIQQQENPPPMPKEPMPKPDAKPKDGEPKPKSGSQSSPGLPSGKSDGSPQPRPRRNRPQPTAPEPRPMNDPLAGKEPQPGEPKQPAGPSTATGPKGGPPAPRALMPLIGDVEKDVWGHLPEQLRQQVSTYYRQQFMPQYAALLRQYYASLAERESKGKK